MSNSEKVMRCMVTLMGVQIRADQQATIGKTLMDVVAVLNEVFQSEKEQEEHADTDQKQAAAG